MEQQRHYGLLQVDRCFRQWSFIWRFIRNLSLFILYFQLVTPLTVAAFSFLFEQHIRRFIACRYRKRHCELKGAGEQVPDREQSVDTACHYVLARTVHT